ncbi:MAG: methyltransferase domain-containing protein [Planctomycetes bacterium]|nr:methyltransferase domain-containing protein [Planctomycetota bacterium]
MAGSTAKLSSERFSAVHESFLEDYPVLRRFTALTRFKTTVDLLSGSCGEGSRVVDLGAWPGILACCLARMAVEVVAVDKHPSRPIPVATSSREMLLKREGICGTQDGLSLEVLGRRERVTVVGLDIEREPLPLETASMDAVLLTEVIEHLWHDPLFALAETNRVLKTGSGVLILSTPNFLSLRNRLNFAFGNIHCVIEHPFVSFLKAKRLGHLGHCRLYAPSELRSLLHLLGFSPEIVFRRHDYLDHPELPASKSASDHAGTGTPVRSLALRRPILRKLLRSPRSYWAAACATSLKVMERLVPRFRPQVFVARKTTSADFDRNYPSETRQLVLENDLSL